MKKQDTRTTTVAYESAITGPKPKVPGLLVAHAPDGVCTTDRFRMDLPSLTLGRGTGNDVVLRDSVVSGAHLRVFKGPDGFMIEDTGSRNGTFVNGNRISAVGALSSGAVIRVGCCVLVFEADAARFFEPPPDSTYDMHGPFHTAVIVRALKEAVLDERHILVVGETGTGKELAARAVAAMTRDNRPSVTILEHNCASYASEEEANSSLWGVGTRIFSNVDSRPGLIEQARDGLLFLDEANALPDRVQKSLLRMLEDRKYKRIGETKPRTSRVRILFASNDVDHPTAGLIHDLYPRLFVVEIPSLKKRIADIPAMFRTALQKELKRLSIEETHYSEYLTGEHFEIMCLAGADPTDTRAMKDNVRGLIDTAKRLAIKAASGTAPDTAVREVFEQRFIQPDAHKRVDTPHRSDVPVPNDLPQGMPPSTVSEENASSKYERHKALIIKVFIDREKRVAPTVRTLKEKYGISASRPHLTAYLKKWGILE